MRAERLGGRAGQTLSGHEFPPGSRQSRVDSLQSAGACSPRSSSQPSCKVRAPQPTPEARPPEARPPEAVVLGIAQDGGVPHAGCRQPLCVEARSDPAKRLHVASLGLLDPAAGKRFLVDATPDFAEQMETLGGRPDGILLTHAHVGHYLGLAQLGREVMGARRIPVYCTPSMAKFLRENKPWSRLVALENITLREVAPGTEVALTESLRATPLRVPHRDEDSDTVAWRIRGPARSILWLPDIDKWEKWDRSLPGILERSDAHRVRRRNVLLRRRDPRPFHRGHPAPARLGNGRDPRRARRKRRAAFTSST